MKKISFMFVYLIIGLVLPYSVFALTLTTNSFSDQGSLPTQYTCDGKNITPELIWSNPPEKTASYALILSDIDAPNGIFYHWVLYNIPSTVSSLPENMHSLPSGTIVAKNSWGKNEYNGPCPPKGSTHYYIFTLYALDKTLSLPNDADANTVLDAMKNHILEKINLSATYGHT